jgi:hypothetical protein
VARLNTLSELQVLYTLEIQPVTLRPVVLAGDADKGVVARGAAHNGTYLAHVSHLGADHSRRAATDAGGPGRGDLKVKISASKPAAALPSSLFSSIAILQSVRSVRS